MYRHMGLTATLHIASLSTDQAQHAPSRQQLLGLQVLAPSCSCLECMVLMDSLCMICWAAVEWQLTQAVEAIVQQRAPCLPCCPPNMSALRLCVCAAVCVQEDGVSAHSGLQSHHAAASTKSCRHCSRRATQLDMGSLNSSRQQQQRFSHPQQQQQRRRRRRQQQWRQ
jgi:hypothetical protein